MKSNTASPRNSKRSLSSTALEFSFRNERCVRARVNNDGLPNARPSRFASCAGDSGARTSFCVATETSLELRERQAPTLGRLLPLINGLRHTKGLAVHQFQ